MSGTVLEPFSKTPAAKDTYTVRVEYLKPTDSDNLPTEDVDYKFTVTLVYAEAL